MIAKGSPLPVPPGDDRCRLAVARDVSPYGSYSDLRLARGPSPRPSPLAPALAIAQAPTTGRAERPAAWPGFGTPPEDQPRPVVLGERARRRAQPAFEDLRLDNRVRRAELLRQGRAVHQRPGSEGFGRGRWYWLASSSGTSSRPAQRRFTRGTVQAWRQHQALAARRPAASAEPPARHPRSSPHR